MEESILTSIKRLIGISEEDEVFDLDLILNINSSLAVINQLGIGPPEGFEIKDKSSTWSEFIGDDPKLNIVKSYVHMRTLLDFDRPGNSFGITAIEKRIDELAWRLTILERE